MAKGKQETGEYRQGLIHSWSIEALEYVDALLLRFNNSYFDISRLQNIHTLITHLNKLLEPTEEQLLELEKEIMRIGKGSLSQESLEDLVLMEIFDFYQQHVFALLQEVQRMQGTPPDHENYLLRANDIEAWFEKQDLR